GICHILRGISAASAKAIHSDFFRASAESKCIPASADCLCPIAGTRPRQSRRAGQSRQSRRNLMHHGRHSSSFKPQLHACEERAVPSASVAVIGHRLAIHSDNMASLITVRDDGQGHVGASIKSAAGIISASGSNINEIDIVGGTAKDNVDFRTTGALITALTLDMDLGAGNDRAYMDFYRGVSAAPLNVDIHGDSGSDSVEA